MSKEPLFIQLYTDEHIMPELAVVLRRYGYTTLSAQEAHTLGWTDEAHLAYAAERGMTILTYDRPDFLTLADEWYAKGREHAGIIISRPFKKENFRVMLNQMLKLLDFITADEMRNTVVVLQQFR